MAQFPNTSSAQSMPDTITHFFHTQNTGQANMPTQNPFNNNLNFTTQAQTNPHLLHFHTHHNNIHHNIPQPLIYTPTFADAPHQNPHNSQMLSNQAFYSAHFPTTHQNNGHPLSTSLANAYTSHIPSLMDQTLNILAITTQTHMLIILIGQHYIIITYTPPTPILHTHIILPTERPTPRLQIICQIICQTLFHRNTFHHKPALSLVKSPRSDHTTITNNHPQWNMRTKIHPQGKQNIHPLSIITPIAHMLCRVNPSNLDGRTTLSLGWITISTQIGNTQTKNTPPPPLLARTRIYPPKITQITRWKFTNRL